MSGKADTIQESQPDPNYENQTFLNRLDIFFSLDKIYFINYIPPMKYSAKPNNFIQSAPIKTYKETIYIHLRDAIIKHQLKPEERVHEKTIAQQFGVSTTPVREAIVKLEGEGFLKIDANRRVTVKALSIMELSEICEVIGVLDGFAIRLALRNSDSALFHEIKRLTLQMKIFHKEKRVGEYLDSNILIHSKIWEASGNKFLNEKLQNILNRIRMFNIERLYLYSKAGIMDKSLEGHMKLMNFFKITNTMENIELFCSRHWGIYGEYLQKEQRNAAKMLSRSDGFSGE